MKGGTVSYYHSIIPKFHFLSDRLYVYSVAFTSHISVYITIHQSYYSIYNIIQQHKLCCVSINPRLFGPLVYIAIKIQWISANWNIMVYTRTFHMYVRRALIFRIDLCSWKKWVRFEYTWHERRRVFFWNRHLSLFAHLKRLFITT